MRQSWTSCGRSDIFRRNALLSSGDVRCFAIWLYSMCCASWIFSVCMSWSSSWNTSILWRMMGTCLLLTFMCSMERSNAMYLLPNDCVLQFLVTYLMVLIWFLLVEMVAVNCLTSGNSGELWDLNFASLGCRTCLKRRSWHVFSEMMLASAPESTFMVCCCPLILMVRAFISIFCDVLMWHSVCFFHRGINGLENVSKMSFFATKIIDCIAGFAVTCVWYFLPTIATNLDRFPSLFVS